MGRKVLSLRPKMRPEMVPKWDSTRPKMGPVPVPKWDPKLPIEITKKSLSLC